MTRTRHWMLQHPQNVPKLVDNLYDITTVGIDNSAGTEQRSY